MNEKKFSNWLMMYWLTGAGIHAQRIETTTASGVPDINVCMQGLEFWIETKVFTPSKDVMLRPYQRNWMHRRSCADGLSYVLALDEQTNLIHIWPYKMMAYESSGAYLRITTKAPVTIEKNVDLKSRFFGTIKHFKI